MKLNLFKPDELNREFHEKYYKEEFDLPTGDMILDGVKDDKGVIMTSAIRPIYELILVADKGRTPLERVNAYRLLQIKLAQYQTDLHVFVQDPVTIRRLIRTFNFRPCKGTALIWSNHG